MDRAPDPKRPSSPPRPAPREARTAPIAEEQLLADLGYRLIAGIDEAGRGSWAGPVAAAAVVLPCDRSDLLELLAGVRDSKLVTPLARDRLYDVIVEHALAVSVAMAPNTEVDRVNVLAATRLAMRQALAGLSVTPDFVLLDAVRLDDIQAGQWSLVGGDRRSLSVAAASIVAKVSRDRYMVEAQKRYPAFQFGSHKGYGTLGHQEELRKEGPTDFHRQTFAPIRRYVAGLPL